MRAYFSMEKNSICDYAQFGYELVLVEGGFIMSKPVSRKVAYLGYAIIIVILLGITELSSAFLPQLVEITGQKPSFYTPPGVTSFYTPPRVTREQYDHYLAIRAPVLGWPSPYKGESATLDGSGARRSPAFPSPGNECAITTIRHPLLS